MVRKLVTTVPEFTDQHRLQIKERAEANGFVVEFYGSEEEAQGHVSDAEIILGFGPQLLKETRALKWYCTSSAGVDRFAGEELFRSGNVILSNSSGAYGLTISEHVIMTLLEILRRKPEYNDLISQKKWTRGLPMRSIYGSRIGLLGTGNIGQECAKRLRSFGPAEIIGINQSGRNPDGLMDRVVTVDRMTEVLPKVHILILSLPKTDATFHILDAQKMYRLRDGAVIINVGRGTCIEQAALLQHLQAGRLYAGLDVFETEPLPKDDPIWDCPNVVLTPHVSGDLSLPATVDLVTELFLEDFSRYVEGKPLKRQIDISRGY